MDNGVPDKNGKKAKRKKNRVFIADRIISGGIAIGFIGIVCFAALLVAMLVIQ